MSDDRSSDKLLHPNDVHGKKIEETAPSVLSLTNLMFDAAIILTVTIVIKVISLRLGSVAAHISWWSHLMLPIVAYL